MNKEELLQAIQEAFAKQQHASLEALAKEAIQTHPTEAFGYAYLAEAILLEEWPRYGEAELCLAKAAELSPQNTDYLRSFAHLKAQQDDHASAQLMWGKILTLDPEHPEALLAKAAYQLQEYQNYEHALEFLHRLLAVHSDAHVGYLYRAEAYTGLEQYPLALEDLEQAKALNNTPLLSALLLEIEVRTALGHAQEVEDLYETLLIQAPEEPYYCLAYGQWLATQERFERAREVLTHYAEQSETPSSAALYLLAEMALVTAHTEQAVEILQRYITLEPEEIEGRFLLAQAYLMAEQYDQAHDQAQTLLDQAKDNNTQQRATLIQGEALFRLGQFAEAEQALIPLAKATNLYQKKAFYLLGLLYHQQSALPKAYRMMKAAQLGQHAPAATYIRTQLQDYVDELHQTALQANAVAITKHSSAPLIQATKDKIWRYQDFDSQKLSGFTPEQVANIKQRLTTTTLLLTERGLALLSQDSGDLFTYRIERQKGTTAILELLPLDQLPAQRVKIALMADGLLSYSKEKGETLVFEAVEADQLPEATKALFTRYCTDTQLERLGDIASQVAGLS